MVVVLSYQLRYDELSTFDSAVAVAVAEEVAGVLDAAHSWTFFTVRKSSSSLSSSSTGGAEDRRQVKRGRE
jgi:hypothetical protein